MSLESDVAYWENRNWDALNQTNQQISQNFEKCKATYVKAVKAGIIDSDDPTKAFKFQTRPWKKSSFTIEEVMRALVHLNVVLPEDKEITKERLTDILAVMNPTTEAYYLKFR